MIKSFRLKWFVALTIIAVLLAGCGKSNESKESQSSAPAASPSASAPASSPAAPAAKVKTVEDGFLTVAIIGDMPMTSVQDGKIIGTDGDLVHVVADKLGLKVKPMLIQWPGPIEAVRTGRADLAIGNIYWTPERAKQMKMTDPVYYASSMVLQKADAEDVTTIEKMKGKKVGTVTGFAFVPDLQEMEKKKEIPSVTTYKDNNALIQDLKFGRIDIGFVDPPTGAYAVKQNPDFNLKMVTFNDSTGIYPALTEQFQTAWCVNPELTDLYDAVNKEVQAMWATGLNKEMLAKYGLDQEGWFVPAGNPRTGVDREPDWTAPSFK